MCQWKEIAKFIRKRRRIFSHGVYRDRITYQCNRRQRKRDVAVTDIPGAYLTTDIDEEVHMILEGKLAEMMVLTAPEVYRTYITTIQTVCQLYM